MNTVKEGLALNDLLTPNRTRSKTRFIRAHPWFLFSPTRAYRMTPLVLFGIETEFGIARDGDTNADVVAESIALVRAARDPGVRMRWDYACEDPHADARGFRVSELRQDTDEAGYFEQDAARPMSFSEIKSDLVLANGARFYNDHAHPEYCTPECLTAEELVVHDRAGERIAAACAARVGEDGGGRVLLYKNNTDFRGHSYGCHENYLLPRSLPWETLVRGIQAFLVTRQVFAGAGKFGFEDEDRFIGPGFQITQRADFFTELQSVDTMQRRPIINTRDEPHANPRKWRRFHVILGDANMSPFATRLKVGTTALVLEALVREPGIAADLPRLADPLAMLTAVSRDPSWMAGSGARSPAAREALDIQRRYLRLVEQSCDLGHPGLRELVGDWGAVLDDLERDPNRCRDRLDWVAKHALIREFQEAEGIADEDPWLRSLDLAYHLLDPEAGLYAGLEQTGTLKWIPDETAVRMAMNQPPASTRAAIRGLCVRKFPTAIISAQWDHVTLETARGPKRIPLVDLFAPEEVLRYRDAVERATCPEELVSLLNL